MSDSEDVRDFLIMTKVCPGEDINVTTSVRAQVRAMTVSQVKEMLEEERTVFAQNGGELAGDYKVNKFAGAELRTHYAGGPTLAFEHTGKDKWRADLYKPFAEIIALTQQVKLEWVPEAQGQA